VLLILSLASHPKSQPHQIAWQISRACHQLWRCQLRVDRIERLLHVRFDRLHVDVHRGVCLAVRTSSLFFFLLLMVALLVACLPARRAMKVNPIIALRDE
jgi:hypothetical protein